MTNLLHLATTVVLAPVTLPVYAAVAAAHLALRPSGDPLASLAGMGAAAALAR